MDDTFLENHTILITRPAKQADTLCNMIKAHGGNTLLFPTIEIVGSEDQNAIKKQLDVITHYDFIVFISTNAVEHTLKLLKPTARLNEVTIAAVGAGTAKKLIENGYNVAIQPQRRYNSEALLNHKKFTQVKGKKILIIKGANGRDLLEKTLTERGAKVDSCEIYRRAKPDISPTPLIQALQAQLISVAIITSEEGMQNLIAMVGQDMSKRLYTVPIIVPSQRVKESAKDLGFTNYIGISKIMSNRGLLSSVRHYLKSRR